MSIEADQMRERVRAALDEAGLSMRDASMRAGLGETWLRDFLSGRYDAIKTDSLTALAAVLRKAPEWLLTGREPVDGQSDAATAEIISLLPRLSDRARAAVQEFTRFQAEQARRKASDESDKG
jgi:transcriptional regulator with XRE-family HTH domain